MSDTNLIGSLNDAVGDKPPIPVYQDADGDITFDYTHNRTSDSGGSKGVKPERMSLIPYEALAAIARVYAHGENKYAANNWRKGYAWSWSIDALLRHVGQFQAGEDLDPESGEPHLGHAAFHVLALLTWMLDSEGKYDRFDDRYKGRDVEE